jgi:hypothetical protein
MSRPSCPEPSAAACDSTYQVLDVAELRGVEGGFSPVLVPLAPWPPPWFPYPPPALPSTPPPLARS